MRTANAGLKIDHCSKTRVVLWAAWPLTTQLSLIHKSSQCVTQYPVHRATALSGSSQYPIHRVRTNESAKRLQSCMENFVHRNCTIWSIYNSEMHRRLQLRVHTLVERDYVKDSLPAAYTPFIGVQRGRKCLASGPRGEVRL